MSKQRLLTVDCGRIMQTFIEQQSAGSRFVSMAPHYNQVGMLMGYLVVVEDPPSDRHGDGRE